MLALLTFVACVGLGDLILTLTYATTIGFAEGNPVARLIMNASGSAWSLACFKVLTLGIGVGILFRYRTRLLVELAALGVSMAMAVLIFRWGSYLEHAPALSAVISDGSFHADEAWVYIGE